MFCNKSLGTNDVIETFPVGRRLAFDEKRGRLWVVCGKCERWNLTPIEERWEAVEACERIFRETRVRVSSENIGLARHPEGLELVRIGQPLRPEFAAWRYGDQFGRRRQRRIVYGVGATVVVGGVLAGGAAAGLVSGAVIAQTGNLYSLLVNYRTLVKLRTEDGQVLKLNRMELGNVRLRSATGDSGFKLEIWRSKGKKKTWHEGEEGRRFAATILPSINAMGGTKETVQRAVDRIEAQGNPERFLVDVAGGQRFQGKRGVPGYVSKMPKATRLALEMALHEEQERRALEGELWLLEQAWKNAEEIAAISDNLLLPEGAKAFMQERLPTERAKERPPVR